MPDDKEKKAEIKMSPNPVRISEAAHRWLKDEQYRIDKESHVKPTFAELIDDLIRRVGRMPKMVPHSRRASG